MRLKILIVTTLLLAFAWPDKLFSQSNSVIKSEILKDSSLNRVKSMAAGLIETGFNAGSGYGEVWIRDFNTFIELSCKVMPRDSIKDRLRIFFQMQGDDGNIMDGYIPRKKAGAGYDYIYSKNAPDFAGHKNTVETDQETSLIQAVYKYVKATNDQNFLNENIDGKSVHSRLSDALDFLMNRRYSPKYGLIYGATTVDWGDVQPEANWGVVLDYKPGTIADAKVEFKVYPNPATAIVNIQLKGTSVFNLADRSGKTISTKTIENNGSFNISKLKPGIYFISTLSGSKKQIMIAR